MKRVCAALAVVLGLFSAAAMAQTAPDPAPAAPEPSIQQLELASQFLNISGMRRPFDELLPNIADRAKTTFIRANPEMQLGVIGIVDEVALEMVDRRAELDSQMSRTLAIAFTEDELRALVDFYSSPTGKKLAALNPQIMRSQLARGEAWARDVSEELTQKVRERLQAAIAAEAQTLQAAPAEPAPATP